MTNPIIPYSFVPGTKAKANEVNANFISLADSIAELNSEKLDNDLSNINATGLDFIKNNTAPARNIGEIVASTIPLTDSSLHILDGTLISGSGTYSSFVNYIAGLVTNYPDLFETEAEWQQSVTDYGVCGKFVYDSVANTVRLPKYGNQTFTKTLSVASTVPVVGNGTAVCITNGGSESPLNFNRYADSRYYGLFPTTSSLRGKPVGTAVNNTFEGGAALAGLSTNAAYSGIIAKTSELLTEFPLDCYYYIVIATSTKTDIQVDIDEIATDLNGKADTDLSNMSASQSAKNEIISWGMPDYTAGIDLSSYTSSSNQFTAPCDGVVNWGHITTGKGYLNNVIVNSWASATVYAYSNMFLPLHKGDKWYADVYSDTSTICNNFFPMKGAN